LQRAERPPTTPDGRAPRALVVVPTRELAIQVTDDLLVAGGKLGSRVLSVYGGRAYEPQIEALRDGVDVVVGTPGRLLDLVGQRYLDLSRVSVLVLDEADRMLDLGFLPDIERIIELVPEQRQTMLFSATMPGEIVALSRRYLTRPTNVRAESHTEPAATPQVVQHVFQAHQMDKPELLTRVLQARGRGLTMVFCQTKRACDRVADDLAKRGFAAAAVHGDLGQGQRERALRAFRSGKIDVLVATDVAARGLDVDDITHVVNYECPEDDKAYLHRIGRTARAGKTGIAVTLVDWNDLQRWKVINTALDLPFAALEETYSTSAHLYAALDIPAAATGTLPTDQRDRAGLAAERLEDIGETGRARSHATERSQRSHGGRRKSDSRSRRRTRGGEPVEASRPAAASPDRADAAEVNTAKVNTAKVNTAKDDTAKEDGVGSGGAPRARRRRRRTRGGRTAGTGRSQPAADGPGQGDAEQQQSA
jgi:superfamily II DNA/RNA helicase